MKTAHVYADKGVDPLSLRQLCKSLKSHLPENWRVETIDQKALLWSNGLDDTQLLAFPGGRDVPYHQALQGTANRHIRRFVKNGGRYLGICAGAYYGCAEVVFEKGTPLEVIDQRELRLFPGTARGTLYPDNPSFAYQSVTCAHAAQLRMKNATFHAYYNGGCCFENAQQYPTVKVIAEYIDTPSRLAAIVDCTVGNGRAILSGVHIEYTSDSLVQTAVDPSIISTLHTNEQQRQQTFHTILSSLIAQ